MSNSPNLKSGSLRILHDVLVSQWKSAISISEKTSQSDDLETWAESFRYFLNFFSQVPLDIIRASPIVVPTPDVR